jgi:multidrug efflux pump subunit AcrA (membrane-fusion protein)
MIPTPRRQFGAHFRTSAATLAPLPASRSAAPRAAANSRGARRALPVLMLVSLLGGCGKEAAPGANGPAPPPPVAVRVLQMAPQRVPIVFDAVGQTEGAKQVEVRARVSGILQKRLYA